MRKKSKINREIFSTNVKQLRRNKEYSKQKLANLCSEKMGEPDRYRAYIVSAWECGHIPQEETLYMLCDILECSYEELIGACHVPLFDYPEDRFVQISKEEVKCMKQQSIIMTGKEFLDDPKCVIVSYNGEECIDGCYQVYSIDQHQGLFYKIRME